MAIFVRFSNGDLAHQMTSERKTAGIRVVVSSSVDKLVKEFLRYLYRCGNGAIPPISFETTKNDPILEPPGGRTVRLWYVGVSFTWKFLSSLVQWRRSRLQISDRTPAINPPVWVPSKHSDVRQTGSRNRSSSSFEWLVLQKVPYRLWKYWLLTWSGSGDIAEKRFSAKRAPPGDGFENRKSVLQFWRYPRGT
jgi:hypothetical protein